MKNSRLSLIARVAILVVGVEIASLSTLGWFYINQFSHEMVKRTHTSMRRVGEMIATDQLPISVISQKN